MKKTLMRACIPRFLVATFALFFSLVAPLGASVTNYVTSTADSGPGSLRQAILELNSRGGGKILFSNLNGPIALSAPLPVFQANARLVGPETNFPLLPGSNFLQIATQAIVQFQRMDLGSVVTINNRGTVAVSRCLAPEQMYVVNEGNFKLTDCLQQRTLGLISISGSGTTSIQGQSYTNVLVRGGSVEMMNCIISGGRVVGASGATITIPPPYCYSPGGNGCCTVSPTPTPGRGGGMLIEAGNVALTRCFIVNNSATGGNGASCGLRYAQAFAQPGIGGGICFEDGDLRMTNCTVSGNTATGGGEIGGGDGAGAGIYIGRGLATLVNCTISGNSANGRGFASSALGGGIYVGGAGAQILNCTITGNISTPSPGGYRYDLYTTIPTAVVSGIGIGGLSPSSNTVIQSSILAGNTGGEPAMNGFGYPFTVSSVVNDGAGNIASMGRNLIGTTNPITTRWNVTNYNNGSVFTTNYYTAFTGIAGNDTVGTNPRLGPLQDNGGLVFTHALLAGSPAIDAGANSSVAFDARGQPRTIDNPAVTNAFGGDGTDIGAFEVNHILTGTEVRKAGNDMLVRFATVSDKTYGIEYRPEVGGGSWSKLPGSIAGTGGIVTYTDADAADLPRRFYRIFEQLP